MARFKTTEPEYLINSIPEENRPEFRWYYPVHCDCWFDDMRPCCWCKRDRQFDDKARCLATTGVCDGCV